jgi:hypothetical protein
VGRGFVFGGFIRPTSYKQVGQVGRLDKQRIAVMVVSFVFIQCWCCVDYILVGGINSGLLPVNWTCKKYSSSIGATA